MGGSCYFLAERWVTVIKKNSEIGRQETSEELVAFVRHILHSETAKPMPLGYTTVIVGSISLPRSKGLPFLVPTRIVNY